MPKRGIDDDALYLIAKLANGGMRDAISLLELCAGSRLPITPALVTDTIGTMGREGMCRIVTAIADRNFDALFSAIDGMVRSSKDLSVFWQELIAYYRDMLVVRTTRTAASYLDLTDAETSALQAVAARFTKETMLYHLSLMENALFAMQRAFAIKRTVAEVTLTRDDFREVRGTKAEAEDVIEIPRQVARNEIALFFYQIPDRTKETRCSIRTRAPWDATKLATFFGGGGHVRAAGCTIKNSMALAKRQMRKAVKDLLKGNLEPKAPSPKSE